MRITKPTTLPVRRSGAVRATALVAFALGTAAAHAGVTGVYLNYSAAHQQTSPADPPTLLGCEIVMSIVTAQAGDLGGASVLLPEETEPIELVERFGVFYEDRVNTFTIEEALSLRPWGDYTYEVSGGGVGAPEQATLTQPFEQGGFTAEVPALTPDTMAALNAMNPLASTTIEFNAHEALAGANSFTRIAIFDIVSNTTVFNQTLPRTATSVEIPSSTLAPSRSHRLYIDFFAFYPRTSMFGAPGELQFNRVTFFDFTTGQGQPACDSVDFNNDTLTPDSGDLDDFIAVLAGGPAACSTGACNDLDFNNDGLFPDSLDLDAFISRLAGGPCLQ